MVKILGFGMVNATNILESLKIHKTSPSCWEASCLKDVDNSPPTFLTSASWLQPTDVSTQCEVLLFVGA